MSAVANKVLSGMCIASLIAVASYMVHAIDIKGGDHDLVQQTAGKLPYPPTKLAPFHIKALSIPVGGVIQMTDSERKERSRYEKHMLIKGMIDWTKVVGKYTFVYNPVMFDYAVRSVLNRRSEHGHIYSLTEKSHKYNYELTQPVSDGYLFQDTYRDGPAIKLITDRTGFEGEFVAKITKLIRFDAVSTYTTVTGAKRQVLVFEDIWNGKGVADVTRELHGIYGVLVKEYRARVEGG